MWTENIWRLFNKHQNVLELKNPFHLSLIAAAGSEPEENERGSRFRGDKPLFVQTQGIVVGGMIKDIRNCGYAQMEESSINESKD